MRIAKADIVPTDTNLGTAYRSWSDLVAACDAFMAKVNSRPHRVTRRAPAEMLAEEQARLHRLPDVAYTAAFGQTRLVSVTSTISHAGCVYSVPYTLVGCDVWVRVDGDELVVVHLDGPNGAGEVARHRLTTPGNPRIDPAHYPPSPPGPLERQPRPTSPADAAFLGIGDGARLWLIEAATAGTGKIRPKMAAAVQLAALHGAEATDWALGHAATYGRFAEGDLTSILTAGPPARHHRAGEGHSLQEGTRAWEGFGQ